MVQFDSAFITGASSGIGREIALRLARRGTLVVVAARRLELLEQLVAAIEAEGGRALACELDVRDVARVESELARLDCEVGGFDLVLANAGVGRTLRSERLAWSDVADVLDVNLRGAVATLIAGMNVMLPRGRGTLAGVSSLAGTRGMPTSGAYSASKAGLQAFLETLEIDLQASGLRVVDIQPGFVRTPMTDVNDFKMPFLMDLDEAGALCVRGLEGGESVVTFPWQLAWPLRTLGRAMPRTLWRWLSSRAARASEK